MNDYDVVIVGSGTAGQTAAFALKAGGLKVAVVEKSDRPGGTCALAGCQPKKWYYEAAESIARSRHLKGKGLTAALEGDWPAVYAQKTRFTSGVSKRTMDGLTQAGIDFLPGRARFLNETSMQVDKRRIEAGHFVLATGARPMTLPIKGGAHMITSDRFFDLETLPPKILFVGGGFISFELAHFAARIGSDRSRPLILEVGGRPLLQFDAQMVDLLVDASGEEGIEVRTGMQIDSIEKEGEGLIVSVASGETFETDLVVHGAGRVPNILDLDLAAAGIDHSPRGIVTDDGMRTSNPRVYAVGDCAATVQLARVADYEALVAARNILARPGRSEGKTVDYRAVPAILFTYPQYGMVGATEDALIRGGIDHHKSFGRNLGWPTYRRIGLRHAAYKLLVDPDGLFLGAHFIGDNTSGLLNTIRLAMINGITADELYWQSIMSPYPTRESDLLYMLKSLVA